MSPRRMNGSPPLGVPFATTSAETLCELTCSEVVLHIADADRLKHLRRDTAMISISEDVKKFDSNLLV